MKTLTQYTAGELEDLILIVEGCFVSLEHLGCFLLNEERGTWVKLTPLVRQLEKDVLDKELLAMLSVIRSIRKGKKTLRFALNHNGADVRLSPVFLSALAEARCEIELGVVPLKARQEMAERSRIPLQPYA